MSQLQQVVPQERFSERIEEHAVNVPVQQVIPQERFSERIEEHAVNVPVQQVIHSGAIFGAD